MLDLGWRADWLRCLLVGLGGLLAQMAGLAGLAGDAGCWLAASWDPTKPFSASYRKLWRKTGLGTQGVFGVYFG